MMLVVDVVKGVQTQTAECLLIGELTCPRMVVVLNKTDLLPADKRQAAIEKMTKRLHKTLENTRCAFNTSPRPSREMLCSLTVVATQPVTGLSTCRQCLSVHIVSPSPLALTHTAHTGPIGFHFSICFVNMKPNKEIKMAVFFFLLLARFKECPVIAVAAKPGGPEAPDTEEPHGVPELIEVMSEMSVLR